MSPGLLGFDVRPETQTLGILRMLPFGCQWGLKMVDGHPPHMPGQKEDLIRQGLLTGS